MIYQEGEITKDIRFDVESISSFAYSIVSLTTRLLGEGAIGNFLFKEGKDERIICAIRFESILGEGRYIIPWLEFSLIGKVVMIRYSDDIHIYEIIGLRQVNKALNMYVTQSRVYLAELKGIYEHFQAK